MVKKLLVLLDNKEVSEALIDCLKKFTKESTDFI